MKTVKKRKKSEKKCKSEKLPKIRNSIQSSSINILLFTTLQFQNAKFPISPNFTQKIRASSFRLPGHTLNIKYLFISVFYQKTDLPLVLYLPIRFKLRPNVIKHVWVQHFLLFVWNGCIARSHQFSEHRFRLPFLNEISQTRC